MFNNLKNAAGDLLRMDLGGNAIEDWVFTLSSLRADSLITIKTYAGGAGAGGWYTETVDGISYVRVDTVLLDLLRSVQNDTVFDFLAAHPDWVGGT